MLVYCMRRPWEQIIKHLSVALVLRTTILKINLAKIIFVNPVKIIMNIFGSGIPKNVGRSLIGISEWLWEPVFTDKWQQCSARVFMIGVNAVMMDLYGNLPAQSGALPHWRWWWELWWSLYSSFKFLRRCFLVLRWVALLSWDWRHKCWSYQSSTCNRDSQCGAFRRTRCLGSQFIFCFGDIRAFTVPGRCLNRSNFFCDVGSEYPQSGGVTLTPCVQTLSEAAGDLRTAGTESVPSVWRTRTARPLTRWLQARVWPPYWHCMISSTALTSTASRGIPTQKTTDQSGEAVSSKWWNCTDIDRNKELLSVCVMCLMPSPFKLSGYLISWSGTWLLSPHQNLVR